MSDDENDCLEEEYDYEYEECESGEENGADNDDGVTEVESCPNSSKSTSPTVPAHNRAPEIRITTPIKMLSNVSDVSRATESQVLDLSSLLEINPNVAQYLLQLFGWKKEKVMESYLSDCEKLMSSSGVDLCLESNVARYFKSDISTKIPFTCLICFDDFSDLNRDGFSLGCNHTFCKDCFGAYLNSQVNDGPNCVLAHCAQHKCKQAVTKDVFYAFLSTDMKEKYDRYVSKHYVESSKSMRFCPAPNCDKVVTCCPDGTTTVPCGCGYVMCFKCGEEAHEPASCTQMQAWNEKGASDGESVKWIFSNTKKCPKCWSRIEKNQGCLHMICRQCGHNFCWVCMGTHHVWVCTEYKPSEEETAELNAAQRAKIELERYLHYYKRYQNHHEALNFASKQRTAALTKMKGLQDNSNGAWIDVQYIQEAVEMVVICRRVLKHTYVFAYYLPEKSSQKALFERHQEMLEENTEKLHGCTEARNVDYAAERTNIVNLTRITNKFLKSLLDNYSGGEAVETTLIEVTEIDKYLTVTKEEEIKSKDAIKTIRNYGGGNR